jgi:hypothetical protein
VSQENWLRALTDTELTALVAELEDRAEQFSSSARQAVNDELRHRKMPLVGAGKSRH